MLPLQSNVDVIGLSHFILTRLLGNPDIAKKYAHPTVPNYFNKGLHTDINISKTV